MAAVVLIIVAAVVLKVAVVVFKVAAVVLKKEHRPLEFVVRVSVHNQNNPKYPHQQSDTLTCFNP